jgi:hypothetical protein
MLAEARHEVGAADHKASMVLAVLGIGFGALLGGLFARDWSPGALTGPGQAIWWVGAVLAVGSVAAAAMAVWPRFTVPERTEEIYYWGHVAAFGSRTDFDAMWDDHPPRMADRTRHQLFELSHIVARKYRWVRVAMRAAATAISILVLAALIGA